MEVHKQEKQRLKGGNIREERRKMNQNVGGNRKLFRKEVGKVNAEEVEDCSKIKDRNRRLVVGEDEVQSTWKKYFEDLYNIVTEEQARLC